MTDEELIAQLEQGALEDLSPAVMDLVRSRLETSPAVRTALVERLHVEQYLAGGIGADNVSRETILSRATRLRPARGVSKRSIGTWIACLTVASAGLVWATRPFWSRRSAVDVAGAANHNATPSGGGSAANSRPEISPSERPPDTGDQNQAEPSPPEPRPQEATTRTDRQPPEPESSPSIPPRPLAELIFEDVGVIGSAPRESDLARWFTSAPGKAHRFGERMVRNRRCGFFDGWIKLRDAWPADGMLRLALAEYDRLRLHFYHGERGVTLSFLEDPRPTWAAYSVSRAKDDILPLHPILTATDEDRGLRTSPTGAGPIDVRWHEGELILSRGDVTLLTAPLAGPPHDVYLEGHAAFRGLAMAVIEGDPSPKAFAGAAERPLIGELIAGKDSWKSETPSGASIARRGDGTVELSVAKTTAPAWASWTLPRRELCEIIIEVDEATPGSGVYIADEQGRPLEVVRFFRDSRTGQTMLAMGGAGDARSEQASDPTAAAIPFVSARPWLRLIAGCGILRVWTGPDGRHWAPAVTSTQNVPSPLARVGLYCKSSESRRSIRVKRIEVRELAGLTTLVDGKVRARGVAVADAGELADWLTQVDSRRPHDIDSDEWRRACALATLGNGTNSRLGMTVLTTLLDDVLGVQRPIKARLAALHDAALVANTWDNHAEALAFLARYRRLGEQAFQAGETRPYSLIRPAQMQCPLASRQSVPATASSLARLEILQAMADGRWDDLDRVCRTAKFWNQPAGEDRRNSLADWGRSLAASKLPNRAGQAPAAVPATWRHPVDEQISPEMFNLMAEFNAALESKDYRDAAGTIASATDKLVAGDAADLLADSRDTDLFVPLPAAVRLAMDDHPELAAALNEHFGPIARQRVTRAISEGDEAALRAATVQFQGTQAASIAHGWLGGAALALGDFSRAFSHFELAQSGAAASDRAQIAAQSRLAAAGLGLDFGAPATTSVKFGDTELTPAEFEALVRQMRSDVPRATEPKTAAESPIPGPSGFRLEKRGEFDGGAILQRGGDAEGDSAASVDWFSRHTSLVARGNRIFVGGLHVISAFDASNGSQVWTSGAPSRAGVNAASAFGPARPLVFGSRVFARRQTSAATTLVAIDVENGQTRWQSRLAPFEWVVSDPVVIGNDIAVLVAPREERQTATTLALAAFDSATGELRWRRPLVRLRDSWWTQPTCQVALAGDALFVALGGGVIACDTSGRIKWLRRAPRIPVDVDGWSALQAHDRPMLAEGRLVVAQKGVRLVECLDPETGRRHWTRVFPDLLSVVGIVGSRVVVHTGPAVFGLDLESGKTQWRYESAGGRVLGAQAKEGVVVARRERDRTMLVWLDVTSGREMGRSTPEGQDERPLEIGPMLTHSSGRHWALIRRDQASTKSDFCEMVSIGAASPGDTTNQDSVWVRRARR